MQSVNGVMSLSKTVVVSRAGVRGMTSGGF